jgi:hypothetical protein
MKIITPMNATILTKTIFSFIQFGDCLVVEIWVDDEDDKFYSGELVLSMN